MADKIKTPAIEDSNFAQNTQPELRTFSFIYNDKTIELQAKDFVEADTKIKAYIAEQEGEKPVKETEQPQTTNIE